MFFKVNLLLPFEGNDNFALVWSAANGTIGHNQSLKRQAKTLDLKPLIKKLIEYIHTESNKPQERFSLELASDLSLGLFILLDIKTNNVYQKVIFSFQSKIKHTNIKNITIVPEENGIEPNQTKKIIKRKRSKKQSLQEPQNVELQPTIDVQDKSLSLPKHIIENIEQITLPELEFPRAANEELDLFGTIQLSEHEIRKRKLDNSNTEAPPEKLQKIDSHVQIVIENYDENKNIGFEEAQTPILNEIPHIQTDSQVQTEIENLVENENIFIEENQTPILNEIRQPRRRISITAEKLLLLVPRSKAAIVKRRDKIFVENIPYDYYDKQYHNFGKKCFSCVDVLLPKLEKNNWKEIDHNETEAFIEKSLENKRESEMITTAEEFIINARVETGSLEKRPSSVIQPNQGGNKTSLLVEQEQSLLPFGIPDIPAGIADIISNIPIEPQEEQILPTNELVLDVPVATEFDFKLPKFVPKINEENIASQRINWLKRHLAKIFENSTVGEVVSIKKLLPTKEIDRLTAAICFSDMIVLQQKNYIILHKEEDSTELVGFSEGNRKIKLV